MNYDNLNSKGLLLTNSNKLLPGISIACIIIGFKDKSPQILLNKFENYDKWMLPASFVFLDESIDDAAARILKLRTGLDNLYLRQFQVFGRVNRASIDDLTDVLRIHDVPISENHWIFKRIISIGYYAFVDITKVDVATLQNENIDWFNLDEIPALFGDDNVLIDEAVNSMRQQIDTIPFDYELLPDKFTMPELQCLYEAILGRTLDRRNFERKMFSKGYIVQLDNETIKKGARTVRLFSFNREKYKELINQDYLPLIANNKQYSI